MFGCLNSKEGPLLPMLPMSWVQLLLPQCTGGLICAILVRYEAKWSRWALLYLCLAGLCWRRGRSRTCWRSGDRRLGTRPGMGANWWRCHRITRLCGNDLSLPFASRQIKIASGSALARSPLVSKKSETAAFETQDKVVAHCLMIKRRPLYFLSLL